MARTTTSSVLLAEELWRLVGRSRRMLWMEAARALEARGESSFTWQTLCYLVRNGPQSQRDLAYANAQHPAGLSRLVDELEATGYVARAPDPKDRRRQLVAATPKGRAHFEAQLPHVMAAVDAAMGDLSREDRQAACALLARLLGEDVPAAAAAPSAKAAGAPMPPRRA